MPKTTPRRLEHFPNLVTMFFTRAREKGDAPFLWAKRDGAWRSTSWREAAETVSSLAQGLRALGLRLALDDFGTGYSTLARLARVPMDTVKIDRFFLADIDHDAQSRRFLVGLLDLGRDLVQGYLVAPPMAGPELTPLLRAERPVLAAELGIGELGPAEAGRRRAVQYGPDELRAPLQQLVGRADRRVTAQPALRSPT